MTPPQPSLRTRFTVATCAVLFVALLAFGVTALLLVDRAQRASLDERVRLAASAIAVIPDIGPHGIALDSADRDQFERIVGKDLDAVIAGTTGRIYAKTSYRVPARLVALPAPPTEAATIETVRDGDAALRVAVARIGRGDRAYGIAVVWGELDPIAEIDRRTALAFALVIPCLLVAAALVANVAAARVLRPIVELATMASEIEAQDLSRRIGPRERDDELGRLCAAFDRMLDRLERAFEGQRRFTSDASHELRAPLSVIRAEADLALRKRRDPEEYERALRAIAAQADDLEALTRDLLAAARGTSGAAALIDAAEAAREAVRRLAPLAAARGIAVRLDAPGPLHVRGDFAALSRAVVCVVHNALRFAPGGSAVDVRGDADARTVRITVHDAGDGFSAAALDHAAERFWRDDTSRSPRFGDGDASGTGLGLAIAAAVAEAAHGEIRLANAPDGGALVTLAFPRAPGAA
ncbi:MAG TPA: HAMP domain-containing sensor histidine kinase [Candidatus Baltobacteraceae bacterium]|nr:HAMP domain-containing sensor histidine kinase [Candidatus Baltobacteraceae bacterium]